jgi:hypothetical protein
MARRRRRAFRGSGLAASTFGKSSRYFSCAGVRHCSNFSNALARSWRNGVPARNSINARLKYNAHSSASVRPESIKPLNASRLRLQGAPGVSLALFEGKAGLLQLGEVATNRSRSDAEPIGQLLDGQAVSGGLPSPSATSIGG